MRKSERFTKLNRRRGFETSVSLIPGALLRQRPFQNSRISAAERYLENKGVFRAKVGPKCGEAQGGRLPATEPNRAGVGQGRCGSQLAGLIGFRASEMAAGI
jgi:hypothetical protein